MRTCSEPCGGNSQHPLGFSIWWVSEAVSPTGHTHIFPQFSVASLGKRGNFTQVVLFIRHALYICGLITLSDGAEEQRGACW